MRGANPTSAIGDLPDVPRGVPATPLASASALLIIPKPRLHCAFLSPSLAIHSSVSNPSARVSAQEQGQANIAHHVFHRTLSPRLDENL